MRPVDVRRARSDEHPRNAPNTGEFEAIAFCPGYLRGLNIVGNFAVIGVSKPRNDRTFTGLALNDNLKKHGIEARCDIYVVDLIGGDMVHWVRSEGPVNELYGVAVLLGCGNTAAVGFRSDEIRRVISIAD